MPALKALLPWLTVLAVVFLLSLFRLRAVATVVIVAWFAYCVYTWVRPTRR